MGLTLVTAPEREPVELPIEKLHARIDGVDDDDLVKIYAKTARRHAEQFLGRALVTQAWKLTLDHFPCGPIRLDLPPLQSVSSVKYLDSSGVEQTLDPSVYRAFGVGAEGGGGIELDYGKTWPVTYPVKEAVRITYVCGYGAPEAVPDEIKAAILLHLTTLYERREMHNAERGEYEQLLWPLRVVSFGA